MRQVRTLGLSLPFRESSVAFALALLIFETGLCHSVQAKIITFDPAGSIETLPTAINASKWITGFYLDNAGNTHSFLRTPDGAITTIDAQGATCGTLANSINRSGVIVGEEA